MRKIFKIVGSIFMLLFVLLLPAAISAGGPLPPADWYAVIWQQDTNTLHWVNATGEQTSIDRPRLEGEASATSGNRLHISPNGRTLVIMAPLLNGREGIGFYDLQTGQFNQTHETQPNEVFVWEGYYPSNIGSNYFAVSLRNTLTNDWRILVFELASGNPVAQLTSTDPALPNTMPQSGYWPVVLLFDVDEGLAQPKVRFQMITFPDAPDTTFPSFSWYPLGNMAQPVVPDALPFSLNIGFDINPASREVVYSWFNPDLGQPETPADANTISTQANPASQPINVLIDTGTMPRLPRWLHGGDWIGYRAEGTIYQPHFVIMMANGQNPVPLGPNIGSVYPTGDGFLAVDSQAWRLYHMTGYPAEGFAAQFGNTLFDPNGQSFTVIYTTQPGSLFTLSQVADPPITAGNDVLAQPQPVECFGALAPRLTTGQQARVTFTDGTALNVRSAPGGAIINQLPEGTTTTVLGGPQCVDSLLWWQIELPDNQSGWAAEGTAGVYYLEPLGGQPAQDLGIVTPLGMMPTATPQLNLQVATLQPTQALGIITPQGLAPTATPPLNVQVVPTATPPLNVQVVPTATPPLNVQVVPTNTPGFVITVNCLQSPPTQLQVGMQARVVNLGGTLGVYPAADADIPTSQLQAGTDITITGGPQCNKNGIRRWQAQVINTPAITGWVAEGFGQTYYLQPQ